MAIIPSPVSVMSQPPQCIYLVSIKSTGEVQGPYFHKPTVTSNEILHVYQQSQPASGGVVWQSAPIPMPSRFNEQK